MSYRILAAIDAHWRPSNQMGVEHQSREAAASQDTRRSPVAAGPGQASTWYRYRTTSELYVLLEGTGRIRIADDLHTLEPLSTVLVEPDTLRQVFNDTDSDQLWMIVGAPPEPANTLEMTPDELAFLYPNSPKALPPELAGQNRWRGCALTRGLSL